MGNRSGDQRNEQPDAPSFGHLLLSLPVVNIRTLKWKAQQEVVVDLDKNRIIIRDWRK